MLTPRKKAEILTKCGTAVPASPEPRPSVQAPRRLRDEHELQAERDADAAQQAAMRSWGQQIEVLYVAFVAERSARTARESQQVRQLAALRQDNGLSGTPIQTTGMADASEHHDD